jgi:hypothetical protein
MAQRQRAADAQLLDFVRTKADSFVKWDLIRFFHNNPHAANTAENIAKFAARDARTVEQELDELVRSGLLEQNMAGTTRIYRYVKDEQIRDLIGDFVSACDNRDFRVQAINLVIEGLQ